MRKQKTLAILCAISLLIPCNSSKKQELDLEQVRKYIVEKNALWSESVARYDFTTVLSMYTDNATLMPPNYPLVRGLQQIKAFYQRMPAKGVRITNTIFTTFEITLKDSTAYEIGQYSMDIERPNIPTISDTGKYSTIWKLQTNGTWKIYVDCWNSNKPLRLIQPNNSIFYYHQLMNLII
ncbi:MAG: DUF4440 domain-containing protein [Bacteroidota bacterium]|nr:DUF4440 domain-containing protein [Bacteroidota bacterium]